MAIGQLLRLGLSRRAVEYEIECGRLHPIHRGVYAVGHRVLTPDGWRMAAVLAGGEGAVASHSTAAELLGLRGTSGTALEVTIPRRRHARRGIRWHYACLPDDEITVLGGVPATTLPRTILDVAATRPRRVAERMFHEAEVLRLTDPLSLPDLLERYPGRAGTPAVRAILAERSFGAGVPMGVLEEGFDAFVERSGLPRPERNVYLTIKDRLYEIDRLWRRERLAVELDGRAAHDTARAYETDRVRDRRLSVAKWRPLRITWRQLQREELELRRDLESLLYVRPK